MASKPSKRKAEALQWEEHKDIIASLYLEQGRTINDVQKIISAPPYNFSRRCVPLGNIFEKDLLKPPWQCRSIRTCCSEMEAQKILEIFRLERYPLSCRRKGEIRQKIYGLHLWQATFTWETSQGDTATLHRACLWELQASYVTSKRHMFDPADNS